MASAQPNKETIYVDVDDEITSIIDKVRNSSGRIIALVLPKRAATLQSVREHETTQAQRRTG